MNTVEVCKRDGWIYKKVRGTGCKYMSFADGETYLLPSGITLTVNSSANTSYFRLSMVLTIKDVSVNRSSTVYDKRDFLRTFSEMLDTLREVRGDLLPIKALYKKDTYRNESIVFHKEFFLKGFSCPLEAEVFLTDRLNN